MLGLESTITATYIPRVPLGTHEYCDSFSTTTTRAAPEPGAWSHHLINWRQRPHAVPLHTGRLLRANRTSHLVLSVIDILGSIKRSTGLSTQLRVSDSQGSRNVPRFVAFGTISLGSSHCPEALITLTHQGSPYHRAMR